MAECCFSCWFLWTKIAGSAPFAEEKDVLCCFSCWFLWTKIAGANELFHTPRLDGFSCWFLWTKIAGVHKSPWAPAAKVSVAGFSELRLQGRQSLTCRWQDFRFSCWFLWTKIAGMAWACSCISWDSFSCWFLWTKIAGRYPASPRKSSTVSVAGFSELRLQAKPAAQFALMAAFQLLVSLN